MPEAPSFYTDNHLPVAAILALRARGIDVVSCADAGLRNASDAEQLAYALSEGRVVVSRDADFVRLHAIGLPHSGILRLVGSNDVGTVVAAVALLHELLSSEEMRGRIEYL